MLRLGARLGAVARRGALGLRRPPLSTMPSAVTGGVLGPPMAPLRAGGGSLRADGGSGLLRLAMASIKPLQKTSTDAPMFKYKPTSPGRRHRLIVNKKGLWKGRPHQKLTFRIKSHAGRNNTGQITIRGRSAPHHRRLYRLVDFMRQRKDPAVVERFEYDPNRSTFIALIQYTADRQLSYILAPRDLAVGSTVTCGEEAPFAPGNAMPLAVMPEGALVHNIEMRPGSGGKLVRGAGTCATLMSKEENFVLLKMPSSEIRKIPKKCTATIGQLSNDQHKNRQLGKAGASAWIGRRSKTRGVAMNAVDHPMGGGEGKSSGGRPSSSPWGWYTKGLRTRKTNQYSSKMIMRRRNHEKLGLATTNKGGW